MFNKCFFVILACCSTLFAELPAPYNTLDPVLPYKMHSFYSNAAPMERLLRAQSSPIVIVELGSWFGASTIFMAWNAPKGSTVYAVDHWSGSPEHYSAEYASLLPKLYEQFLSNMIHAGVADIVVPLRMSTREAAEHLQIKPDLVYVDAGHDEVSVYTDLCDWFPKIQGHGLICGDDWGWGEDLPVQKAVKRFAIEQNLKIETNGWFWLLRE